MKKYLSLIVLLIMVLSSCDPEAQAFELLEIPVYDLIPEGIAYDTETERFFLSGLHQHKIISFDRRTLEHKDFIPVGYSDYGMGVGMKVDSKRSQLIALSSQNPDSLFTSRIHFLDLDTGNAERTIIHSDTSGFFFNDLDLDDYGNIYISDTEGSRIFRLKDKDSVATVVYQEDELYPNGVALDDEGENLYIASWQKGILKLDLEQLQTSSIHPQVTAINSQGLDGLYYYDNSLIGIQNGYQDKSQHKVLRFFLNENDIVTRVDTLAKDHSAFDVPTTGVVIQDRFYFIANSQLDNLNQETNEITDTSILNPIIILGVPLH